MDEHEYVFLTMAGDMRFPFVRIRAAVRRLCLLHAAIRAKGE